MTASRGGRRGARAPPPRLRSLACVRSRTPRVRKSRPGDAAHAGRAVPEGAHAAGELGTRCSPFDDLFDGCGFALFMSARRIEFLQRLTGPRKARANRSYRNPERESGILVAQPGPGAEHEHVLVPARKLRQKLERPPGPLLVVEPLEHLVARIGLCWRRRHTSQSRPV